MTQTYAADMARHSLDAFLGRIERQPAFSVDEAREFLASCAIPIFILDKLGQIVDGFVDRGVEGRTLSFILKEFVAVLDLAVKGFATGRGKLENADLPGQEKADGLELLRQAECRASAMHDEYVQLLQRLEKPPQEVSPTSLPADRGEENAPGYLGLGELTRLLSRKNA